MYYMCLFIFFKQKTAYEMRTSDWSSDVCSSDLNFADRSLQFSVFLLLAQRRAAACAKRDHFNVRGDRVPFGNFCFARDRKDTADEIGRASCRERVCQYV